MSDSCHGKTSNNQKARNGSQDNANHRKNIVHCTKESK